MDPSQLCPGKGLVLPTCNIDNIAVLERLLLISLPNNEMSKKSHFAVHKALVRTGGESKSVKRLLLIETVSSMQTKSFLLVKTFLNSPVTISPHKSPNICGGVISESDLMTIPESKILNGFSDQAVNQVRRIVIKDTTVILTKHLILTFNSTTLPKSIKAGYLNCKLCSYVPNLLRCFKCQKFDHSQTACLGQLTCSRCASVGHVSSDCNLEQKCIDLLTDTLFRLLNYVQNRKRNPIN
ncbi:putative RNA-directed DNA polymerase from transposon BS [Trichonephila clavipes]|nr:putative RNA-directed DNA polymerase from transposon BS [Trichonephila clavipes]